jgi:SAM-dependent methyltransferase
VREDRYRAKFPHRGRGVRDLDQSVGGVLAEIEARLVGRDVVRVLELGCGFGTALVELRARFGRRIELHGVNRTHHSGDVEIMVRTAQERGLLGGSAQDAIELPSIVYADVAAGLPYPDDFFDLVFSQVAWLYFGNKVGVIREVIRVLREDGVAKIDADEIRDGLPPEYARLVEIWENGKLVPFGEYARRYGGALVSAPEGEYLKFGKLRSFGDDLEPVLELDLSRVHPHWDGVKCVYRVRATAPPASGRPGTRSGSRDRARGSLK